MVEEVENLTYSSRQSKEPLRKEKKVVIKEGVVDLTYSKNQRKQPLKEIVRPDGTIQKVPFARWKRAITTNPFGATAERSEKKNDPDLDKIRIPIVELADSGEGPIPIEPSDRPIQPPRPSPIKDLTYTELSEEKRNKFLSAEFGKVGNWHKIEPLEVKEEKEEEEING